MKYEDNPIIYVVGAFVFCMPPSLAGFTCAKLAERFWEASTTDALIISHIVAMLVWTLVIVAAGLGESE